MASSGRHGTAIVEHRCGPDCDLVETGPWLFYCKTASVYHRCGAECTSGVMTREGLVCRATGRVTGNASMVHYSENTRSGSAPGFVLRRRGSTKIPLKNSVPQQERYLRTTVTNYYCGKKRRNAVRQWKEMIRSRMPSVKNTANILASEVKMIAESGRQSFIPEVPQDPGWLEKVVEEVIVLWRKIGTKVAPSPSPAQLKAFACAVIRWLSMQHGLVVSGVPVIQPVAVCIQYGVSDLDVKRIIDIQCRNVHQMAKSIKKAIAGSEGLLEI